MAIAESETPAADPAPRDVLRRAMAEALTIPKQAEVLTRLAWPEDGGGRTDVACAAREKVWRFGHAGLPALRAALARVDKLYTADVTAAFVAARWHNPSGEPPDYLPGLVDALWFGSAEAQRLAMIEVSRVGFSAAVTPIIDACQSHPALVPVALHTFGRMADSRGRFFVRGVLVSGPDRHRESAARVLARFGDVGLTFLREEMSSEDPAVRDVALEALLPFARPDDLTAFYEYLDVHGETNPELSQRIRDRTAELEEEWAEAMGKATEGS